MKARAETPVTKLLIYSHYFAPSVGGVETSVLSLASGLSENVGSTPPGQFQVTIVTLTAAEQFDDRSLNFRIVRRPSLVRLVGLILDSDVIHLAGPSLLPQLIAYIARKPVVLEHHGYQSTCPNGLLLHQPDRSPCAGYFLMGKPLECLRCQAAEVGNRRAATSMLRMALRYYLSKRATVNVAITNHVLRRQNLPRTETVYYGIESGTSGTIFKPPASAKVRFAFVGRLVAEKGIPVLLEALRILKEEGLEFDAKLIGEGPQRQELEEIIRKKDLQAVVSITGFLKGGALANAMEQVSVVVMPSVWEETAGLAAIEQMMRGRPVVASNIGGLAEVLGDTGLLSPVGDARALAERMKTLIADPGLIRTLGERARERARVLFARKRMVDDHALIYLRLAER